MTEAELNARFSRMTGDELEFYVKYRAQVPDGDEEAKRRYIEKANANRTNLGTPELYYSEWPQEEPIVYTEEERIRQASINKRIFSVNAHKEGLKKWLLILRHHRFDTIFDHSHSYIEINYMYAGSCTNIVDGQEICMEAGDFLIMKPGTVHRVVWLGENDFLMNLILLPHDASSILNSTLFGTCDLSNFFVDAVYSQNSNTNYLFLKTRGVHPIQNTMTNLFCEYYEENEATEETTVGAYLRLVFALIWKECVLYPEKAVYAVKPNAASIKIVNYIHDNCAGCTREEVAARFGYSSSRISNLIKEYTGKSFLELRNEFRMALVEKRLSASSLTVKQAAEECGFTNMTQFYKVYRDHFGRLPREN